ncbi:type II toxin-antitoxin system RelB/DinJ family antitoxin [Ligilactobacillus salivarius]|uniref:type II toxin-antitoxin system RelB/DinJ family antitoxin n=1 Tax=Ligilactobacillus salivarius TaxID=1624 RepID=UPI0036558B41
MGMAIKSNKAVVTVRVKPEVKQEAKDILESSGITLSDFIRMSLAKVVEDGRISFLDTPEALEAKRQAENGEYEIIGDADDFNEYVRDIVNESSKD